MSLQISLHFSHGAICYLITISEQVYEFFLFIVWIKMQYFGKNVENNVS